MNDQKQSAFRGRLGSGEAQLGTFVKTPAPLVCEILGASEMDVICLDAEHAPFGRLELDSCLHTLRAADMPSLVRLPTGSPVQVLNALDAGATGVLVPHVTSAEQARAITEAAHFGRGGRGYAGSTRAAGFTTTPMAEHLQRSRERTTVIVQIEDVEALERVESIAAVEGVDGLFVGRIDLTVAMGADSPEDEQVVAAVEDVCRAGRNAGMPVGMFVSHLDEVPFWVERGAGLFLLQSDQVFLMSGAARLRQEFDKALPD